MSPDLAADLNTWQSRWGGGNPQDIGRALSDMQNVVGWHVAQEFADRARYGTLGGVWANLTGGEVTGMTAEEAMGPLGNMGYGLSAGGAAGAVAGTVSYGVLVASGAAGADRAKAGWEAFLSQARQRVADAYARYGARGIVNMAMSRKDALTRLDGLAPRVVEHLDKIAKHPTSQAVGHWRHEVTTWITDMEAVLPHIGRRTAAEWSLRITQWRSLLGE